MAAVILMPILILLFGAAELFGLIEIGKLIGGGPILGEILLTGVAGAILLRVGAGKALSGMVVSLFAGRFTVPELLRRRELRLLLAGVSLLIPGILSDLFGVYLLGRYFTSSRVKESAESDPEVIDVEYKVYDDRSRR